MDEKGINVAVHVAVNESAITNDWLANDSAGSSQLAPTISLIKEVDAALKAAVPDRTPRFTIYSTASAVRF